MENKESTPSTSSEPKGSKTEQLLATYEAQQSAATPSASATTSDTSKAETGATSQSGTEATGQQGGDQAQAKQGEEDKTDPNPEIADEFKLAELDPELAKNPAVLKRWNEQQAGVEKIVSKAKDAIESAKAKEAEFEELMPGIQRMVSWGEVLENPETVADGLADLVTKLAALHGKTVEDLIGGFASSTASGKKADEIDEAEIQANYREQGFDSPGEYRAYKRAELAFNKKFAALEAQTKDQRTKQSQAETKRTEEERFLQELAPTIVETVKKTHQGFTVTPQQVAEAIKAYPALAKEPAKAVIVHFAADYQKHLVQSAKQEEAPTMVPAADSKANAVKLPPPGKRSALDIMRANGIGT